jgi:hypothetical protein
MLAKVQALETLPEQFMHRVGPLSLRLSEKGFELQTDPYGRWWDPTVTGKSFDQRDGLKNALHVSRGAQLKSLMVLDLDHYAYVFHQRGSVYAWGSIPARLMVPIVSRGLGRWGEEYHELCRELWQGMARR